MRRFRCGLWVCHGRPAESAGAVEGVFQEEARFVFGVERHRAGDAASGDHGMDFDLSPSFGHFERFDCPLYRGAFFPGDLTKRGFWCMMGRCPERGRSLV